MSQDEPSTSTLQTVVTDNYAGSDLVVSAFVAAVSHFKRATIATPFPLEVFQTDKGEKDLEACQRAIDGLVPLQQLRGPESSAAVGSATSTSGRLLDLPSRGQQLLEWLLTPSSRRPVRLRHVAYVDFLRQLQDVQPGFVPIIHSDKTPTYVFQNKSITGAPYRRSIVAFHGTTFERLHSILNVGLQPASGTRLQRNGANHGEGIYLTTDYGVAFSFCQPAYTWKYSALGYKLRCMLVCEVDADNVAVGSGAGAYPPAAGTSSGSSVRAEALPEAYLLVNRPDAVRITHVLVYCDARYDPSSGPSSSAAQGPARRWQLNWCTALIVLYAGLMLLHATLQNRAVKLWLRNNFEIHL